MRYARMPLLPYRSLTPLPNWVSTRAEIQRKMRRLVVLAGRPLCFASCLFLPLLPLPPSRSPHLGLRIAERFCLPLDDDSHCMATQDIDILHVALVPIFVARGSSLIGKICAPARELPKKTILRSV